ncbi:MAG: CRISPR-associated endonuclease Cas2 [Christensenellaceae bacterium]|jgi:CRISPR-associated protein Cas2|nr:CRISPR-associated endonuclease Cas2 [Christensenellaceae bacterium]
MLILVTYDVSTETKEGRRRLHRVAKRCIAHGQRVQNSVFECKIDYSQYLSLQNELKQIIKEEEDSLRFYNLGINHDNKVIHVGKNKTNPVDGDLII